MIEDFHCDKIVGLNNLQDRTTHQVGRRPRYSLDTGHAPQSLLLYSGLGLVVVGFYVKLNLKLIWLTFFYPVNQSLTHLTCFDVLKKIKIFPGLTLFQLLLFLKKNHQDNVVFIDPLTQSMTQPIIQVKFYIKKET